MAAPIGVTKRLALLRGQLDQVEAVLAPVQGMDGSLYDELQPLLVLEVAKLRDRVDQAAASNDPWVEFREVKGDALSLFTECLGFLGGAVALRAQLDSGRCQIANHLVAKIRRDGRLRGPSISVPAEREYVNTMSDLIRVRFPGEGLWDLPVVVHEFGHAVCDQVGEGAARSAVEAAAGVEQKDPDRLLKARYEELWADVVGTYVAGPAYAATCLLIRFDPSAASARDVLDTHPSVEKRAVAILVTLGHLEERRQNSGLLAGSFASTTAGLDRAWRKELSAAGKALPSATVDERIRAAAAAYCKVLDANVPTLRYPHLGVAEAARRRLEIGKSRPPSVGILDALNAAWLARIVAENNGAVDTELVATRAFAWCQEVAGG